MGRKYVPNPKHKRPKGFGSLCPHMDAKEPQSLLERAIAVPEVAQNALWVAQGCWLFKLHPSPSEGEDCWHGFPVVGSTADERVLAALVGASLINGGGRRTLRK